MTRPHTPKTTPKTTPKEGIQVHGDGNKYVGLWVTSDNHVRQRLLPDERYVEARGSNERAYTGRYKVTGDDIEYWDDTGFTADGNFRDDILYHGGMVMHRASE